MEIFFSEDIDGQFVTLDEEESGHCVRVLRHRRGDVISVIDGLGTMMRCEIVDDSPKGAVARVVETFPDWGAHPYRLDLAVCPTKNADRYEWMVEKACEIGVDSIIPLIGERSERRVVRTDRLRRIALSACKQSLKGRIPTVCEPVSVMDFLQNFEAGTVNSPGGIIAHCLEDDAFPRVSIREALERTCNPQLPVPHLLILIGPEGDFSPEEVRLAMERGFVPVHLGSSRLRTETAAMAAVCAVYFHF